MKKLLLSLLLGCLLKTAVAQLVDLAWFQNQYHNTVKDFAFYGTQVWIAKPDYVMMLDTTTGQTQVFNDFVFPENAYFGSSTMFSNVLVDDSEHVYVNYYGIENGIYKYNGQTWTNFPAPGFPDQNYTGSKLMMSSQHHLFMAQGKTVGEFDGANWQTFNYTQSFNHGVIDSHDTLWLTTSNGKLVSFFNGIFTTRLSSGAYYAIAIDDEDNLFIPLSSQKILKFHGAVIDTITVSISTYISVYVITADSNGQIYMGGYYNHYYKFDGSTWTDLNTDIPGNFEYQSAVNTDAQHHVWFGSTNGFLAKQENDLTAATYVVNYSGLPDDGNYCVSAFFFTGNYEGEGFLGTQEGLFHVDWMSHLLAKVDSGFDSVLTDKRINCIEKPGDYYYISVDTAWFGTNEGLIGMNKDYHWVQFTKANSPLPNDTINYILYDYDKLWIATNGGAACYHFNGNWQTFTSSNSSLPSDKVHSISKYSLTYIFCTTNGVAYYTDPDWKILNTSNSGLIDNDVASVYKDFGIHNYFGTVAHGICDSVYNGNWTYFNTSNGLPSDSILFITPYYGWGEPIIAGSKGAGILSFQNGNYLYNTSNIQGIDFSDATDQTVLSLGEVAEMWITTDKGLLFKDFGGNSPVVPAPWNGVTAYFSNEELVINYELKPGGSTQFELFDISGKRLNRVKTYGAEGKNSITIPAPKLGPGIYILHMQSGDQTTSVKAVKIN